jgi:hypothetical protein
MGRKKINGLAAPYDGTKFGDARKSDSLLSLFIKQLRGRDKKVGWMLLGSTAMHMQQPSVCGSRLLSCETTSFTKCLKNLIAGSERRDYVIHTVHQSTSLQGVGLLASDSKRLVKLAFGILDPWCLKSWQMGLTCPRACQFGYSGNGPKWKNDTRYLTDPGESPCLSGCRTWRRAQFLARRPRLM